MPAFPLSRLLAWFHRPNAGLPEDAPFPPRPRTSLSINVDETKIPTAAREKVAQIKSLLADLESRCAGGGTVCEFDELRRISTIHLPRLVQSYVEIPPDYRAEVFRETGRSASYILVDQLEKLLGRLREISRMLAQGDVDAFNQNVRFIDMQYGSSFPGVEL